MKFYEKELHALKRAGRYRKRKLVNKKLHDFVSNDYLGLSENKELHALTCKALAQYPYNNAKASMLLHGYHQIHKDFEDALCKANNFEAGIVLGSGFNANLALIESLVRRGDTLFMDELYHASGVLASQLRGMHVVFFKHNDMQELKSLLQTSNAKRKIVAVEGIYSMDGDLCDKEVFSLCDEAEALLIVDEAHSSGVIGKNLLGVFDHYNIPIKENYIKMGTLGKAYGSFGAFILSSTHIADYLLNRAKPIIYATALSLYDTLLAHNGFNYILQNKEVLKKEIAQRQAIVQEELHVNIQGLIVPVCIGDNQKVIDIKEKLITCNYSVGAIRQPTVTSPIIRLIARVGESKDALRDVCRLLAGM
ncbi:MAG TPA: aminotransferase class I/II-fold pyridoxal phosphate-dependent enzyme [Sulfurimonas autotrophica]|nr:aminotransferase class I/II-fold pyridoxal phosphate-dependent enzyme [Sulfurimonas autotrophica]